MAEGVSPEAGTEAVADVMLRREVRLEERAEGDSMAVEAPLVVYFHSR